MLFFSKGESTDEKCSWSYLCATDLNRILYLDRSSFPNQFLVRSNLSMDIMGSGDLHRRFFINKVKEYYKYNKSLDSKVLCDSKSVVSIFVDGVNSQDFQFAIYLKKKVGA